MSEQPSAPLVPSELATVEAALAPAPASLPSRPIASFKLMRDAFFLSEQGFAEMRDDAKPARRGFLFLLTVLGIIALSRIVGFLLGLLFTPRTESLQRLLYDFVIGQPWYAQQTAQSPGFASQFSSIYNLVWDGLRILLGFPSPYTTALSIIALFIFTPVGWFGYSVLAHVVARWFGGRARFGQLLGVMALAYAPMLIYALEFIPGFVVPASLVFLLMLLTKYVAVKTTHGLPTGYSVATVIAPYLLAAIVVFALLLFGGAIGLSQIPGLDTALRLLPLFR